MKPLTRILATATLALAASQTQAAAEPGHYRIDPAHTSILFTVGHLNTSRLVGRFNRFEGEFVLQPGQGRIDIRIDTASVDTNHQKRDKHLRSPDFFNARQFPQMRFVSQQIRFNQNGEPVAAEGRLSLHGKQRPVSLKITPVGAGKDPWGGYRAGYTATTTIKRSDFGMDYMLGGIGDEIAITLEVEGIKQ